jgi:hypothetical protein
MKRILYMAVLPVAILFLYGSAGAVDKTKKDTASIRVKPPVVDTIRTSGKSSGEETGLDPNRSRSKYDNFIDLNNNGVDDRAEKQSPTKPKKEPVPDSTSLKPPKK